MPKNIKLEILKNNYYFTLEEYYFEYKWKIIKIPKWFYFDGWSLPRFLYFLAFPVEQPYLKHFMIHDFLYSKKSDKELFEFWIKTNRKEIDLYFLKWISSISKIKWFLFYIWVYIFWGRYYKKDFNKEKIKKEVE